MNSLLNSYFRDISKYRPLTSEQEITLFNQMHLGHQSARDQLICAHLLLVVNIARRYTHPGTDIMDLIQEGNIGLMHAVDIFDPTQGTRFTTYAVYKIHKQIQRFLNKNDDRMISLDINVDNGDENLRLSDTIEDKDNTMMELQFENIQTRMEQEEVKEQLQEKLKTLSSHELQVLRLLYGLDGYPEMSYEEVAQHMGIRADSVRRIKMRAKRKITCPM
jgi:RNA polymerase sigma factor (sigma-70 family)